MSTKEQPGYFNENNVKKGEGLFWIAVIIKIK
jgi:hypothetical protein